MFAGQVKGLRGADGAVRTLKDVGEYDVWSTVIIPQTPAGELNAFSYGVGGNISGSGVGGNPVVTANKQETNMRTPNQFVDESMNVYGVAIQPCKLTKGGYLAGGADKAMTLASFLILESDVLFRFHVGGDKPFAEGRVTWFPAGGGTYATLAAASVNITNHLPTHAAIRRWEYTLPIGRVEKFWGEFSVPRASAAMAEAMAVVVRLLGVRARGVQ